MSYLVLARKWRPKDFNDTVGQEHVLRALRNALDSERLHHAYLFAGTRGVGKTTIARILAKCLNCDNGITANPCGTCSACMEIDQGRFVDLIEVDAASKTKVDDTRELLDNVQYAPARGRFKVYLIDEVHMLSKSSFNALLKTLEEPPPHVKFLLATTDPQKLPVTVLSRCLQFNLKRLTPDLIRERLSYICGEESVQADRASLAMIARAADGSLRDALSLLDQAIAYCGGAVESTAVSSMLGTIDREHVGTLLSLLADGDAPALLRTLAEIDEQFPDYGRLLDDLARMLQRVAVFQVIETSGAHDELDEQQLADFADRLSAEDLQLFYQTALIGRRDLHLAPDPKSGVEMTLLRMLAFQPEGTAAAPAVPRKAPKKSQASPPVPRPKTPQPAERPASRDTSSAWQEPDWPDVVRALDLTGASRMLVSGCAYLRRDGNTLYLSLDSRSESLLTSARQHAVADALSRHFGEALRIEVAVGAATAETPLQAEARIADEKVAAARESLEADPNVRALKDMFGATLNADSVQVTDNRTSAKQE